MGYQNNFLFQLITKGDKRNFDQIINWYNNLIFNIPQIVHFLEGNEIEIPILFKAITMGFISKSEEVANLTCNLITQICDELLIKSILTPVWEWFCRKAGGLDNAINCFKIHPNLEKTVANLLMSLGKQNLLELFSFEMRKVIVDPKEYISMSKLIFQIVKDDKFHRNEVLK